MNVSIISKLLSWTGVPQWAQELAVIGVAIGGVWLWHQHTLDIGISDGIAKQQKADSIITEKAIAQAHHEHDMQQAQVNQLDAARQEELDVLHHELASRSLAPIRLCSPKNAGSAHLPSTSSALSSGAPADPTAGSVLPVSSGDIGVWPESGPDISGLFSALAGRCDSLSAQARELIGLQQLWAQSSSSSSVVTK